VLASLNHPHIGAIYGLAEADGFEALVLEDRNTIPIGISKGDNVSKAVVGRPGHVDTVGGRGLTSCRPRSKF
jgi:hypothetical protein